MWTFEFFTGEDATEDLNKFIILTIIIWTPPVLQTIWLALLMFTHPIIEDVGYDKIETRPIHKAMRCFHRSIRSCFGVERMKKEKGGYKWEETRKKYREMALMLKQNFGEKDWANLKKWILVEKVNIIQYQKDDRTGDGTVEIEEGKRKDNRSTLMRTCKDEFQVILNEVESSTVVGKRAKCTNMMKIINHHIRIMNTIELMKQINIGMQISAKTDPNRKGSMEWRGVIEEVTKLEPGLKFPDALRYNQIRKLSNNIDEEWDHGRNGTELDPHSLIIDPWGPLEKNAVGYIKAYLLDTWIFYFQIYFVTVILEVLFA